MKKSQSSLEVSIILGTLMFFFIFFIAIVGKLLIGISNENLKASVNDIADHLESELKNAAYYEDGFVRVISVPATLDRLDYVLEFSNTSVTRDNFTQIWVSSASGEYIAIRQLPENIEGRVLIPKWREITLRKENGVLRIN